MTPVSWTLAMVALAAAPPLYEHIRSGDASWAHGDRVEARTAWEQAATSPHPATAAMAEARLLQISGNVGLALHGPRMDAALARCPPTVDWCALARHDAQYFSHRLGLGPPPGALPASADPELVEPLRIRSSWSHEPPPTVPTWTLGISPYGASGLGFGAAVVYRNPDLRLRGGSLHWTAGSTTSGNHLLSATLATGGPWALHLAAQRQKVQLDSPGAAARWASHTLRVGALWRRRTVTGWLGGEGWLDRSGFGLERSGGLASEGRATLHPHIDVHWSGRAIAGDGSMQSLTVDLRTTPQHRGLATRWVVTGTHAPDTPVWRVPTWGGGSVLRHGHYLQYRSPLLVGGVLEWRQPVSAAWAVMGFAEAAHTDAVVTGVGTGLRVSLPPRPSANLRIDGAVGGTLNDWRRVGISTGWDTAF